MARYTETIYASDSWAQNYTWEQLTGTVRGASLTSQQKYSFTYDGDPYSIFPNSNTDVYMRFPLSGKYKKKRLEVVDLYVYVTGTSSSASGNISNGRILFYYDSAVSAVLTPSNFIDETLPELSRLVKNQYNFFDGGYGRLSKWAKQGAIEICPNVGVCCTGSMYKNTSYNINVSMAMQSHTGTNKPYVICTYEDVVPKVKDCAPNSGFINEKEAAVFRWKFQSENYDNVQQMPKQQAYQFRWRVTGQSTYKEATVTSANESGTVPAGTFPEKGSIDWCVRVQSDDGIWSEWSSWMTLTTVDSVPVSTELRPDLGYVDGSIPQVFSWKHVIGTGTAQSRFEVQYRTADGDWTALAAGEGAAQMVELLPGALPSGKIFWRVRTANSDRVWGSWSEPASIVVRASPPAPVIGQMDGAPRPLVCWQAQDQQGYQVRIGSVDSQEQYGAEKQWRCPVYLDDGSYTVGIRVKNEFGLWSSWSQAQLAVKNCGIGRIIPSSRVLGREILLSWNVSGTFSDFLVKRDGKIISVADGTVYKDRTCVGIHRYELIGRQADFHYVSSEVWTESLAIQGAAITGLDGGEWISLSVRRGGLPVHQLESQALVGYQHYYGHRLPAAEISKGRTRRHRMAFSLPDNGLLPALQELVGCAVIYKDQWGSCFTGILEGMTIEYKNGADLSFTITETEEEEIIG